MFKRHYDKVVALLVLAGLLCSLLWIGIMAGQRKDREQVFQRKIDGLTPRNPEALVADSGVYSQAMQRISEPYIVAAWTNAAMFIPESRVFCVHVSCKKPIPKGAKKCLHCGFEQQIVVVVGYDADGDGIPDAEEEKLGLNPRDPDDAAADFDEDGFSNIEEWRAGTGIRDATSHPPKVVLLRVKELKLIPFEFVFKSTTGRGEKMDFWFSDTRTGVSPYGRLNQPLKNAPEITVIKYIPEAKKIPRQGVPDAFFMLQGVVVKRGNKELLLIRGERRGAEDPRVTLVLPTDGSEFPDLTFESEIDFDGKQYRLIDIDIPSKTVVLLCLTDESKTTVQKLQ